MQLLYEEFKDAGYRFFGLYPITNGVCGCGDETCKVAGKHPYSASWQFSPDWSDDQIEVMQMTGQLETGYGVLCKGLIVIDIDARNGGVESWSRLSQDVPEIAGAGLIVETGSGGGSKHLYFKAPEGVALVSHLPQYKGIDFKSSGYVVGAGSLHKSGNYYNVVEGSPHDIGDAPQALIDLLRKPDRHRAEYNGAHMDVSHADLADMLNYINPDCDHETWVKCGMACHEASGGTAFSVWDEWSARGSKYPDDGLEKRWHSFGKSANPVTLGTLIYHAEQGGWVRPVAFDLDTPPVQKTDTPLPVQKTDDGIDTSGIDLNCPPSFVGIVTDWINDQCFYERRKLAVGAALTAIGNIAGMRYTDDKDGVTTNLFTFGVAGSRSGKEAVHQALTTIMREVGLAPAVHGSIKSEQEIVTNLVRHQPALYNIDEIGELLRKIKNAQDKGGAVYLDGVIGMLMAAYSKANKFMLLTGDKKDETRSALFKELAKYKKMADDDRPDIEAEQQIEKAIDSIDNGLDRPFLSMHGYTVPVTFDALVDYRAATNGFIGRCLIFYERETVPKYKEDFKPREMPDALKMALLQIYNGGEYETKRKWRIQRLEKRIAIPSTPEAIAMLKDVHKWLHSSAYEQKGKNGLESLYLGSYELVAKVSLILAVAEGLRTAEHVRWAFALVKRDIEEKIALVVANDSAKDSPALALMARVIGLVSGDDGETLGVITNRCRGYRKEDVERALEGLVTEGRVRKEEKTHPKTKKTIARYFKV